MQSPTVIFSTLSILLLLSVVSVNGIPVRHMLYPKLIEHRTGSRQMVSLLPSTSTLTLSSTSNYPSGSLKALAHKFARQPRRRRSIQSGATLGDILTLFKAYEARLHRIAPTIARSKPTYPQHVYDTVLRDAGYIPNLGVDESLLTNAASMGPSVPDDVKTFYSTTMASIAGTREDSETDYRPSEAIVTQSKDDDNVAAVIDHGFASSTASDSVASVHRQDSPVDIGNPDQRFWDVVNTYLGMTPSPTETPTPIIGSFSGAVADDGVLPTVTPKPFVCPSPYKQSEGASQSRVSAQAPCANPESFATTHRYSAESRGREERAADMIVAEAWRAVRSAHGVPVPHLAPDFQPFV